MEQPVWVSFSVLGVFKLVEMHHLGGKNTPLPLSFHFSILYFFSSAFYCFQLVFHLDGCCQQQQHQSSFFLSFPVN
jgi:hypothetical protein